MQRRQLESQRKILVKLEQDLKQAGLKIMKFKEIQFDEQIGKGGFGEVFKGIDLITKVPIAIKVMKWVQLEGMADTVTSYV